MSHADFSKIVELVELRERLRLVSTENVQAIEQRKTAAEKLEDDIKRVQQQIKRLRGFINDGQRKLDSMPQKYSSLLEMKDEKARQMKENIERLRREKLNNM